MPVKAFHVRLVLLIALLAVALLFLVYVQEILVCFALGALMAYLLFRPVLWIEKKGIGRLWAILLLYLIVFLVIGLIMRWSVAVAIREAGELADSWPQYLNQVQGFKSSLLKLNMPEQIKLILSQNFTSTENYLYKSLDRVVKNGQSFLSHAWILVLAPVLTFYMIKDWEKIRDRALTVLWPQARDEVVYIANKADLVIMKFIKGHLLVAVLVGLMTGLLAYLAGIRSALLIGVVVGIFDLIPYFGPFLGAVPAVLIALTQSFKLALYMVVIIAVVQQVESSIITPKIIGDRLEIHPLLIIFILLAGGELGGVWGMLLAIPVAVVLKISAGYIYLRMVSRDIE